jgi:MYXO-CTERM domain-containing protein
MRPLLVLLPLIVAAATPRPADACSAPPCRLSSFVPADGTTIPANAPGLYWRPAASDASPANVRLTTVADPTTALPFTATKLPSGDYVIVPDAPLAAGTAYVLEDLMPCTFIPNNPPVRNTFTAGPSAPLPQSLGGVSLIGHGIQGDLEVGTSDGSCSKTVDAVSISVQLEPSADAQPWLSLLLFQTLVDDAVWSAQRQINVPIAPGESWKGRGIDLLYRVCEEDTGNINRGLSVGGHRVQFRGALPGVATELYSSDTSVELMCDSTDPDPDDPLGNDGGGCSSSGAPSLLLALLALALLLARRTS